MLCVQQNLPLVQVPLFKRIWKWRGPNRIRAFLWKLVHGRLFTNEERVNRGMASDPLCPRCKSCLESIMHIVRDCDEVKEFWSRVIPQNSWSKFFSLGLFFWLDWNLSSNSIGLVPWPWFSFFSIAVHSLWKDRNSLVLSQTSTMGEGLWQSVITQTKLIENELSDPLPFLDDSRVLLNIGWKPPPTDFCQIQH